MHEAASAIILRGFRHIEPNIVTVGITGAIMFPAYWLVWEFLFPQPYENLPLRLVGSVLCLGVALKDHWPARLKRFLPVYWLVMLMYCLPFFFTFMMLQNGTSTIWLMSALTALFLLVLLVDWLSLIVLFVTGSSLAFVVASIIAPGAAGVEFYAGYLPVFMFGLIGGMIFNYNAAAMREAQQRALGEIATKLSKELQAPLLGIRTSCISLKNYLPDLIRAHQLAENNGVAVVPIDDRFLSALQNAPERITDEVDEIHARIDRLLVDAENPPREDDGRMRTSEETSIPPLAVAPHKRGNC